MRMAALEDSRRHQAGGWFMARTFKPPFAGHWGLLADGCYTV
jgi:hypothetical protein